MACDFHFIGVSVFRVIVISVGKGQGFLKNGTRLIPGDQVSRWGTRGIKYAVTRSTPKVCGMDFP